MQHASKFGKRKPQPYEFNLINDYLYSQLLPSEILKKYKISKGKMWEIIKKHNIDTSLRETKNKEI